MLRQASHCRILRNKDSVPGIDLPHAVEAPDFGLAAAPGMSVSTAAG